MNRRKFIGGVAAGVAVALLPETNIWDGIAADHMAANMTATEVLARQTLFQKQFAAEFFQGFEQQRVLMRLLASVDIKNCGLAERVDQLVYEELNA